MLIHKLIALYTISHDYERFYLLQAQDAIRWMRRKGVPLGPTFRALDLGCGHGIFGSELMKTGCQVTFADVDPNYIPESLRAKAPHVAFDIDREPLERLGQYDLVISSNVFEHLSRASEFLSTVHKILTPNGYFYLSWTNGLSPWGGHDFSPFHYLGYKRGYEVWYKLFKRKSNHIPYQNLFPTYIGKVLRDVRNSPTLSLVAAAPRYYTELAFLLHIPIAREFLTWNCALLIKRKGDSK